MNLDAFIAGLTKAGLDLDVENVLDALWLAQQPRAVVIDFATVVDDPGDSQLGPEASKGRTKGKKSSLPPVPPLENQSLSGENNASSAQVFAENVGENAEKRHRASPVSIPAAQALPGRLALARSLRPFLQRWRSHRDLDLNEELTVEKTAELHRYLYPVFRPRLERWFDVSVVIEDEPAVAVWSDTLRDFCQTLRETGAFQDVRLWRLRFPKSRSATTDSSPEPYLETPAGGKVSTQVLTGGTRRLIFFATHGSSSRWFDGSYARVLASWTGRCSVVLLHLLPRSLWKRTPLGYPNAVCNTREPGVAAARLEVERPWWTLAEEEQSSDLVIPCIPLNPTEIAEWSAMQMARGHRSSAYVLSTNIGWQDAPSITNNDPEYFERMLSIFRSDFPEAARLATYLASGPFTLPVARLVQEAKFGAAADQSTLAEVLLSGLVTARFVEQGTLDDDSIYYDFHPEARKILLRSLRRADAELIAGELERRVSEYIEQIHGRQVSFRALVRDARGKYDLPDWAQPFALLGTSLLGIKPPQAISANAKDGKPSTAAGVSPQADAEALFKTVHVVKRLAGSASRSIRRIAWSPDGRYMAAADHDGTVQIWNVGTERPLQMMTGHTRVAYAVCWSPHGEKLASGSGDGSVRIWNRTSGVAEHVIGSRNDSVLGVAWSPAGDHIACCTNNGHVLIYRADTGEPVVESASHKGPAHSVAWSPDGRYLASAGNDGKVKILDMSDPRREEDEFLHGAHVYGVAWSPHGSMIASCGSTRSVKLWRHHRRQTTELLGHENDVTDVSFSADGKYVAAISRDDMVRIWSVRGHGLLATLAAPGAQRFHSGVAFHPFAGYGLAFITGKAAAIEIWAPTTASEIPFNTKAKPQSPALTGEGLQPTAAVIDVLDSIGMNAVETAKFFTNPEELGKRVLDLALEQGEAFENHLRVMQAFAESDRSEVLLRSGEKLEVVVAVEQTRKPTYDYYPDRERILEDAVKTRQPIFVTIGLPPSSLAKMEWIKSKSGARLAIPLILGENRPAVGVVNLELTDRETFAEPRRRWLLEFCKALARRVAEKANVVLINGVQQDHPIFAGLIRDLRQAGVIYWLATGRLGPGASVQPAVQVAMRNSGWLLFILSQRSLGSYWATSGRSRESLWGTLITNLLPSLPNPNLLAVMIEECSIPVALMGAPLFRLHFRYKDGVAALIRRLRETSAAQSPAQKPEPSQEREAEALRRTWHPPQDIDRRGPLTPCSFSIRPRYLTLGAQRWEKWADVLVALDDAPNRDYVYLLPSRFAPERFHDPGSLGRDNSAVELKRKLTTEFVTARLDSKLTGWMFTKTMGSGTKAIHVYSPDYDDFLSGRHYHAEAVAIRGERETVVQPGLNVTLPAAGGHISDRTDTFKFRDLFSFHSAHTQVSGSTTTASRMTIAVAVIEGLNIMDVLTVERVVAQISIEYPRDGKGEPRISLLGTAFVNVRIAGSPVEIELDMQVFDSGKVQYSLVRAVRGHFAGNTRDNIVDIPDVGKLVFGELSLIRETYQLTMIRFDSFTNPDISFSFALAKAGVLSPVIAAGLSAGPEVRQPTGRQTSKPTKKSTPPRKKPKNWAETDPQ